MKSARRLISMVVLTIVAVGQIVLAILLYDTNGSSFVRNIGWVILWVSAVFGWLPILTFKRWGGVPQRKSFVHTTVLVDRGVYSVVRHPQYLAGILICLALALIAQHWAVTVLGAIGIVIYYGDTYEEEKSALAKFGKAYRAYMETVPRVNFALGIARRVRQGLRRE